MPCSVCRETLIRRGKLWVCPIHGDKAQASRHRTAPEAPQSGPGRSGATGEDQGRWEEAWRVIDHLEDRKEALEAALAALAVKVGRLEAAVQPKAILGAILAEGDRQMREDVEAEEADRAREAGLQAARDRLRPPEG